MEFKSACSDLELCLLDQAALSTCKRRNIFLEKSVRHGELNATQHLKQVVANCSSQNLVLTSRHQKEILDLQSTCAKQVQVALTKTARYMNLNCSVSNFSKLLKKKTANLDDCNTRREALLKKFMQAKHDAKLQVSEMSKNCTQKVNLFRAKLLEESLAWQEQVRLNHVLAWNNTDIMHQYQEGRNDLSTCRGQLLLCDTQFHQHSKNITYLNATMEAYKEVIMAYMTQHQACIDTLKLTHDCASSRTERELEALRRMNEKSLNQTADCLTKKFNYYQNVTRCQHEVILKNTLIRNLTLQLRQGEICNNTLILSNQTWVKQAKHMRQELESTRQENAYLLMHTANLTKTLKEVEELMDQGQTKTTELTQHVLDLEQTVNAQKLTITELLKSEQKAQTELQKSLLMCNATIPFMSKMQKHYWSNKRELLHCISERRFQNKLTKGKKKLTPYQKIIHESWVKKQATILGKCMESQSQWPNTTQTDKDGHLKYTIDDLETLLELTKNTVPADPKLFTSQNHLKTCKYYHRQCQNLLHKKHVALYDCLTPNYVISEDDFEYDPEELFGSSPVTIQAPRTPPTTVDGK